jgi:hypothetical protein
MDLVMIRPPCIDNGAFVVSPDSVWYARVLLLFSDPNVRLRIVLVADLQGFKDGT